MPIDESAHDKHWKVGEVSKAWNLGRETIRRLFKDEPGVIKIQMGRKKAHVFYSIPDSVLRRVHNRLSNSR
jgi:hypothetical protein